jgi:hypothetical protein
VGAELFGLAEKALTADLTDNAKDDKGDLLFSSFVFIWFLFLSSLSIRFKLYPF